MFPTFLSLAPSGSLLQNARIRSGVFYLDVVPVRTSAVVPSILGETALHRRDAGTPEHCRQHNGPQLLLLRPGASASAVPKDRKRNAGKRSRAAAKSPSPAESPFPSPTIPPLRVRRPSATS